jgi:hypothetical protein
MAQVIVNTSRAVFAAVLETPAGEVPPMMTDQTARTVPPPTSAFSMWEDVRDANGKEIRAKL